MPCKLNISRKLIFNWAYSVLFQHLGTVTHKLRMKKPWHVLTSNSSPWSPLGDVYQAEPLSSDCVSVRDTCFQHQRGNGSVESFFIAWISLTELNRLTVKMEVSIWWRLKHFSTFWMHWIKGMKWDLVSSMDGWAVSGTVWTDKGLTYSLPTHCLEVGTLNVNKTWQFNLNKAENR